MRWLGAADEHALRLSSITIGEIRRGIMKVADPQKQARLETFLAALRSRFAKRVLAIDADVAERWGRLTEALGARGVILPAIDSLIAATAIHHDLTVVTRDEADFRLAGVSVINPFT